MNPLLCSSILAMKFSAVLISSILFFAGALARPSRLAERIAAREARRSGFVKLIETDSVNVTHATSENWSGVAIESPPSGQTFTSVVGTFTVPTPTGSGAASAWVSIDGRSKNCSLIVL